MRKGMKMEGLKDETREAIKRDEFATKAIEAAIIVIYAHRRDWNLVGRKGRIPFVDEQSGIAYAALCSLIGQLEPPAIDGKVNIGGADMDMSTIQMLDAALA